MKMQSFFPDIWAKLWKNVLFYNVEESFKKFVDLDLDADDFQYLSSSFLSKDTSLAKFL